MDFKSLKVEDLFNFEGQVAALTGASDYLVGTISRAFGENGVKVALLDPFCSLQ
jgi:NAD(P)-dependent dehydrogenase (short-subunit alcohol dehydrogenase family)